MGQHRRRAEAGGVPPGGQRGRLPHQHERAGRRPAAAQQAVHLRLVQPPADSRQRARLPGAIAVPRAARRHQRSGHDRHHHRHRPPHLPACRAPLRRLWIPAALRQAEPQRRTRRHAGLGLEGIRRRQRRPGLVGVGAVGPPVRQHEFQLQQRRLPALPEDGAAAARGHRRQRAVPQPHQHGDHAPAPLRGAVDLAVQPAERGRRPA